MSSSNLSGFLPVRPPEPDTGLQDAKADEKFAYEIIGVLRLGPLQKAALLGAVSSTSKNASEIKVEQALKYLSSHEMVEVAGDRIQLTPLAERAARAFAFG